jgi:hypothetical protein
MINIRGKVYDNARVQIYMDHPIFYKHRKYWFFAKCQESVKQLMTQLEHILQSCENVSINEVIFKTTVILNPTGGVGTALKVIDDVKKRAIIQILNKDTMCLGRAVVTSIVIQEELQKHYYPNLNNNQIKYVKESRPLQKSLSAKLYKDSNVQIKENGNDLDDVKLFENYLKLKIIIFNGGTDKNILYSGNDKSELPYKIYLYFNENHYNVITNICGFLACRKFCDKCFKSYTNQHSCHSTEFEQIVANIPEDERCKFPGLFKGCQDCLKQVEHKCNFWYCEKCDKIMNKVYETKEEGKKQHICHQYTCSTCGVKVVPVDGVRDVNHKCYMQPNYKSKVGTKIVFFDFETDQSTGTHEVNYCIAAVWCPEQTYYILISPTLCIKFEIFKSNFSFEDITYKLLMEAVKTKNINEFNSSNFMYIIKTYEFKESVKYMFYKIFISDEFSGYTFIAHYGKGFDFHPVLAAMLKNKLCPDETITNGNKINYLKLKKLNIRFIDSINFTMCPLRSFPATFGIDGKKGYFPHYFNIEANQNYNGPYPDKKYYGYDMFTTQNKKAFDVWYLATTTKVIPETGKVQEFNFKKEIFEYCFADTELLLRGCLKLRDLFLQIELGGKVIGEDPFQYITIAQLCTKMYRHIMPENTIAIIKNTSFDDKHSKKSIQWLEFLAEKNKVTIQHARRGGEVMLPWYDEKTKKTYHWKFDGYDSTNKTVYEFYGCYFHGCPQCFPNRNQICNKSGRQRTMEEVYAETLVREERIQSRFGKLVTMWEHTFDQYYDLKNYNLSLTLDKLKPRDAFYGGRTESVRPYHKFEKGLKGKYYDFVSLYPTVQYECKFPIGHPVKILPNNNEYDYKWFGLIKCKLLPPRGLYHPVLPYKQKTKGAHKLLFGLCQSCMARIDIKNLETRDRNRCCDHTDDQRAITGTWATIEVEKALEKGYKMIEIYEVHHFDESSTELFKSYIRGLLKIKAEASGCPCGEKECPHDCPKKLEYIRIHKEVYDIKLDPNKIIYNAGLRFIAKICLNNLWGHFGMREEFKKTVYVSTLEEQVNIIYNDKYKEVSQIIINDEIRLMEYKSKEEYRKPNKTTNIYIACFTTAHARLRLYELLEILSWRVLYMDTDSVIFIDDNSEECRLVQVKLGDCLGMLTNEFKAKHIMEFAAPGPKDNGFILNDGTITMKNKGVICNAESEQKITMPIKIKLSKSIKKEIISLCNTKFILSKKNNAITVKLQDKKYTMDFNKRMIPNKDDVNFVFPNWHNDNDNETIMSYPHGY